jgi:hypothetical protein
MEKKEKKEIYIPEEIWNQIIRFLPIFGCRNFLLITKDSNKAFHEYEKFLRPLVSGPLVSEIQLYPTNSEDQLYKEEIINIGDGIQLIPINHQGQLGQLCHWESFGGYRYYEEPNFDGLYIEESDETIDRDILKLITHLCLSKKYGRYITNTLKSCGLSNWFFYRK